MVFKNMVETSPSLSVLFFLTSLKDKGPTTQTVRLARQLKIQGVAVKFVVLKATSTTKASRNLVAAGIEVIDVANIRFLKLLLLTSVVHSTGFLPDLICCLLVRKKWLATVRNVPFDDYPTKFGTLKGTILAYLHLTVLGCCKYPVGCSEYIKNTLLQKLPRIEHIDNAGPENVNCLQGMVNERRRWLVLGSLLPRKNNLPLIKAFVATPELGDLIVVGAGVEEPELREHAAEAVNIHFLGQLSDPTGELIKADFLVSNSLSEGLPNSVLEGIAHKCACVLSSIEPHQYLHNLHPSQVGILDGQNLQQSLVKCKERFEGLPAETISNWGLSSKLSVNSISMKYQKVYTMLARKI